MLGLGVLVPSIVNIASGLSGSWVLLMGANDNINCNHKASNTQLNRAAGSQTSSKLQQAVDTGWTAYEINHQEGKTALHIAAWKGCLENVQYLVDQVGCDINAYSKGEFNYGKTAIFYAATQSREDVVECLLDRNAKVNIVNNKGQSVLSLCATHEMSTGTLQRIQALEAVQGDWWNFRATHSDGLEYGDLDPRFCRNIRATDVVTEYAINPTTSQTRKGGFARRNPEQYKALTTRKQPPKKQTNQKKRRQAAKLTTEEEQQLKNAWKQLEESKWKDSESVIEQESIRTIITLNDKQFQPWLPEAADRLMKLIDTGTCSKERVIATLEDLAQGTNTRFSTLVQKLLSKSTCQETKPKVCPSTSKINSRPKAINIDWNAPPWKEAREQVQNLSISVLEQQTNNRSGGILRLPQSPFFVSTVQQLMEVKDKIQKAAILALDTEWRDTDNNQIAISTLQLALVDSQGQTYAFVVDLIVPDDDDDDILYRTEAQAFVKGIFASNAVILGFSFGNDLPLLEAFAGSTLRCQQFLDIQQLLTPINNRGNVLGLQSCAALFSELSLSKDQQCSKWENRPLSNSQLEYAGLDAAILLFLLGEYINRDMAMIDPMASSVTGMMDHMK